MTAALVGSRGEDKDEAEQMYCTKSPIIAQRHNIWDILNMTKIKNQFYSLVLNIYIYFFHQGWVFNVIPWLVAIPSSLFSGCLSDHLISQGWWTEQQISGWFLTNKLDVWPNAVFTSAGYDIASVRKFMQVQFITVSSLFCLFVPCLFWFGT